MVPWSETAAEDPTMDRRRDELSRSAEDIELDQVVPLLYLCVAILVLTCGAIGYIFHKRTFPQLP
jgi:hypothetical protein